MVKQPGTMFKASAMLPVVALAIAAAAVTVSAQSDCWTGAELDSKMADLQAVLADSNFGYVEGLFTFFNITSCETQTCSFNNPTSPYAYLQLPNNPAQPPLPYQIPLLAVNGSYRMEASEAAIFFGCTPPESLYYGFTPYVTWHYRPTFNGTEAQKWVNVFGSMSDTVNQASVKTFSASGASAGVYGTNTVFILTGSETAFAALSDAISQAWGIGPDQVNVLPLPGADTALNLTFGLDVHSDFFSIFFRQALATDSVAYENWQASNPFRTVRVWYNAIPENNTMFGAPDLKPRVTLQNELDILPQFNALVNATLANLEGRYSLLTIPYEADLTGYATADWGGQCFLAGVSCSADNRDTVYLTSAPTPFFTDPTDQYIVLGANHVATGMANYSNLVIYNFNGQLGLNVILNDQYQGSADIPVPNYSNPTATATPAAASVYNEFFLWKFARSCGALDTACSAVSGGSWPSLPNGIPGIFMERAYDISAVTAGPDMADLIKPYVVQLSDKCKPQPCDATGCSGVAGYFLYDIAYGSYSVSQSSTLAPNFGATNAIDGTNNGTYLPAVTNVESQPFWEIDLTFSRNVSSINIVGFWADAYILFSNTPFTSNDFATSYAQASEVTVINSLFTYTYAPKTAFQYMRIQYSIVGIIYITQVSVNAWCSN